MTVRVALAAFALLLGIAAPAPAATPGDSQLQLVVVVMRHGIRSPLSYTSLDAYASQPWAAWPMQPGELTPHGASLVEAFGAAYRDRYATEGVVPATGCPAPQTLYVRSDTDRRDVATARALVQGLAPGCSVDIETAQAKNDPLFHGASVAKGDPVAARAALAGSLGETPSAILAAYRPVFDRLETVLGCTAAPCVSIESLPWKIDVDGATGLASLKGPLSVASAAVENLLLEYADGRPNPGWSRLDAAALLDIDRLHVLGMLLEHANPYAARAEGSNLLAHLTATLDQSAGRTSPANTRAPAQARFAIFAGHDTNLANLAGLLHLSWLLPGYQFDDTPPGGALVFELRRGSAGERFVRLYFAAQSLEAMRAGDAGAAIEEVPVYIPGCPDYDCPIDAFDTIARAAVDPRFVAVW